MSCSSSQPNYETTTLKYDYGISKIEKLDSIKFLGTYNQYLLWNIHINKTVQL